MQAEFGGEVGHRAGAENSGIARAPGAILLQVFELAAIGVVDAAVEHQLGGAALELRQRDLIE